MPSLKIALWNLNWATTRSRRAETIREYLAEANVDVICFTEAYSDFLSEGYQVESQENYGYRIVSGRRKTLLWSKHPWTHVDTVGSPLLPSGRFVSASCNTPIGVVRFVGVCIPWRDAHVSTGAKNRKSWQDHLLYLEGLGQVLRKKPLERSVILGDFNQRIPRVRQPKAVFDALMNAFPEQLVLASTNVNDHEGSPTIDHVLHTPDLESEVTSILSKDGHGQRLSDHFGLTFDLHALNDQQFGDTN